MCRISHFVPFLVALHVVISGFDTLSAQAVVRGTVRADSSRRPLRGAEVSVESLGWSTRTDSGGRYSLSNVPAGLTLIRVRLIGYASMSGVILVAPPNTIERDFTLERAAVELDSMHTVARKGRMGTFDDNRRVGLGHFFTRDDLDRLHATHLADVMSGLASVNVRRGTGNHAWISSSRSGRRSIQVDASDRARGATSGCYANVFLNGVQVYHGRNGEPLFDLNEFSVDQIEGIEYYTGPAEAPIQYSSLDMSCGVLAIWTHRN